MALIPIFLLLTDHVTLSEQRLVVKAGQLMKLVLRSRM